MTRQQIAAVVAVDYPFTVELVKGEGYWYFTAELQDAAGKVTFYETYSEMVMYLNAFSAERWVASGRAFLADCIIQAKERGAL